MNYNCQILDLIILQTPVLVFAKYASFFKAALMGDKSAALKHANKSLAFGYSPYPLLLKMELFHRVLKEHRGFNVYMEEIKNRSEAFVI